MSAAGSINTHIQKADVCSIACSVANVPQHADYRKLEQFRLCAHYVRAPRLKYTPGAFLSIYAKRIHGASLTQWRLLSANIHLFFLRYQTGSRLHFSIQRDKIYFFTTGVKGQRMPILFRKVFLTYASNTVLKRSVHRALCTYGL